MQLEKDTMPQDRGWLFPIPNKRPAAKTVAAMDGQHRRQDLRQEG